MNCYYAKKYPYLNYPFCDEDGRYIMFSVPPKMLSRVYKDYYGKKPKTFFDCGAATGVIVQMALNYGMDARGIDIKKYPIFQPTSKIISKNGIIRKIETTPVNLTNLYKSGRIQIKSILDCKPIRANLAYCNGTLTYFDEMTLPLVLSKFQNVNMLCAIHNTTEDIDAAKKQSEILSTCATVRNIKPNDWWIDTFKNNGFNATFNKRLSCFIVVPQR